MTNQVRHRWMTASAPGEWIRETKLINEVPLSESDFFGHEVALDGNVLEEICSSGAA